MEPKVSLPLEVETVKPEYGNGPENNNSLTNPYVL